MEKVLLAKLVWEYGLKLNSKLLMKINYFEIRAAKCGMTDVEWKVHVMKEDEEWRSLVCRPVLARLRIEMIGLQIESDLFDHWFADLFWPLISGLQTCSGQTKNGNDWFADWVWPILITGLQICSGQIENWNYWFADWVWPNLHWLNGWYLKWAAKCDIWMRNKNCI